MDKTPQHVKDYVDKVGFITYTVNKKLKEGEVDVDCPIIRKWVDGEFGWTLGEIYELQEAIGTKLL